jgi:nitrile hydratase
MREPRKVLAEFSVAIDPAIEIKVWESSAQIHWFIIPERPSGSEPMSEAALAALGTPEATMGVALPQAA